MRLCRVSGRGPGARAATGEIVRRWMRFNSVGALGVAVHVGVVAVLIGWGVHYLWATAIAVETAVLHNFLWHEGWTWRDRRGPASTVLTRAVRFHLTNGVISLGGNLVLMRALTGTLDVEPVSATVVSIVTCSMANFFASELYVFRRAVPAAVLCLLLQPAAPAAAAPGVPAAAELAAEELKPRTLQAWSAYEQKVDARYLAASESSAPFFAMDQFGVPDWRAAALRGGLPLTRLERPRPGDASPEVPDGKIHHWAGAIFIRGTTVSTVLDRLARLAGDEARHYEDVIASKLLARDGDHYRIYMKLERSKIITATYNTEHAVTYRRMGPARASARSVAVRIAELEDAGRPGEREKPVGNDRGFLWRLNAYWRYEAVNGGVLIECESVSLSRGVPLLLRPFVTGTVEGLAKESLERTLSGLRTFLSGS